MIMKSLSLVKEKITKDVRNIFRLKIELNYTAIKVIRNHFRQEKETKTFENGILRDIKNLFKHEEENKSIVNQ